MTRSTSGPRYLKADAPGRSAAPGRRAERSASRLNSVLFAASARQYLVETNNVDVLLLAVEDARPRVRLNAVAALACITPRRATGALLKLLRDPATRVREAAAEALCNFGSIPAAGELIDAFADGSSVVRRCAAQLAAKSRDSLAVGPLIALIDAKDQTERCCVIAALGEIGQPCAVDALVCALRDSACSVRWSAAEALGKIGDVRAVDPLTSALLDEHTIVYCRAAEALGRIGDQRATEPLIAAFWSRQEWARDAAIALGKLANERAEETLAAASKADSVATRAIAVEALAYSASRAARKSTEDALSDNDISVRRAAVRGMGDSGDIRYAPLLVGIVKGRDGDILHDALDALAKIGPSEGVEALVPLLSDPNELICVNAAKALGSIGDPRAVPELIAAVQRGSLLSRKLIAKALESIPDLRSIGPLVRLLADPTYVHQRARCCVPDVALDSLLKIAPVPELAAMVVACADVLVEDRVFALTRLRDAADSRAGHELQASCDDVPSLCRQLLGHPNATVREEALVILRQINADLLPESMYLLRQSAVARAASDVLVRSLVSPQIGPPGELPRIADGVGSPKVAKVKYGLFHRLRRK